MRLIARSHIIIALFTAAACASTQGQGPVLTDGATATKIEAALAGAHRPAEEKARDVYRHPAQTLSFFGLRDDMTVVEIYPSRGWYTAVLAPVLAEKGRLVLPIADPNGAEDAPGVKYARALKERMDAAPEVFGKADIKIQPTDDIDYGPAGSADLVVTFRSLHGQDAKQMDALLTAVHSVLKTGGTFGVVDHRANEGADPTQGKSTGYLPEQWVIDTITAKGFTLAAKSEVNANPKDTKNYPEGVWSLPPSLKEGDKNRDAYLAIGESDRMTLRFVKN